MTKTGWGGRPEYYGTTREALRDVFDDDAFAPDGEDLTAALRRKMAGDRWVFFAHEAGMAGTQMYNVRFRGDGGHPTTHFFAGMQDNTDPVGCGSVLVALQLGPGSDLCECPVKAFVVLAERSGSATYPVGP